MNRATAILSSLALFIFTALSLGACLTDDTQPATSDGQPDGQAAEATESSDSTTTPNSPTASADAPLLFQLRHMRTATVGRHLIYGEGRNPSGRGSIQLSVSLHDELDMAFSASVPITVDLTKDAISWNEDDFRFLVHLEVEPNLAVRARASTARIGTEDDWSAGRWTVIDAGPSNAGLCLSTPDCESGFECVDDSQASPFGTCLAYHRPQVSSADYFSFGNRLDENDDGAGLPLQIELVIEGTSTHPVTRIYLDDMILVPEQLDGLDPFVAYASFDVPWWDVTVPHTVAVADDTWAASEAVQLRFTPANQGQTCAHNVFGACAPGSYCHEGGRCAAFPEVDGISCEQPQVLDLALDSALCLVDAPHTHLDTVLPNVCLEASDDTGGMDHTYQFAVPGGATLAARISPMPNMDHAGPLTAMLTSVCPEASSLPSTLCLDASSAVDPMVLSYRNRGLVTEEVYLVIDRGPEDTSYTLETSVYMETTADGCPPDNACVGSSLQPSVVLVVDYATQSFVSDDDADRAQWTQMVASVDEALTAHDGFIADRAHWALIRFGHDTDRYTEGTLIEGDTTGLIDGVSVDVRWDAGPDYTACNAAEISEQLALLPAPVDASAVDGGIGRFTRGGLERAGELIEASRLQHATADSGEGQDGVDGMDRPYAIILITDGRWTDATGTSTLSPQIDNPATTAADLLALGIPTHVVFLGDDANAARANDIAEAGGTTKTTDSVEAALERVMRATCLRVE